MITSKEALSKLHNYIGPKGRIAFFSAFLGGLLTHIPAMVSDIPNHDGLASMYFDQNMITSGRWFLGTACAPSSFFTLPWIIGVLAVLYISLAAMALREIFDINDPLFIVLSSLVLVTFPGLSSNFAYVFTMDGYMLGMLLCVLSVWCVKVTASEEEKKGFFKKANFGWIIGGVLLAFGMGCYQSYVCIAMLLCLVKAAELLFCKKNIREVLRYLYMGAFGVLLYYVLLTVLLKLQGKVLDTYQGINGMSEGNGLSLIGTLKLVYSDFLKFSLRGRCFTTNIGVTVAILVLLAVFAYLFIRKALAEHYFKKPLFYIVSALFVILLPLMMNAILFISAEVVYHVLMRYQWAFLIAVLVALTGKLLESKEGLEKSLTVCEALSSWIVLGSLTVIIVSYAVTCNLSYSNLQKKYEKTYSYCLRLADRIEQTEGYYQGIPVALVGVVGEDSYPLTDVTGEYTSDLLGISGDYLLYKSENYGEFFKNYLGISFNMVSSDEVINFYDEDFYATMPSFPAKGSVLLHDGTIYVKTENIR